MIINVVSGADLQSALDDAEPGDEVVLVDGETYVGNFVLGLHKGGSPVVLRSATEPPEGRLLLNDQGRCTDFNPAKLQAAPGGLPALRTEPGVHDWYILGLELLPNPGGYGEIVSFGDGSANQHSFEQLPYNLTLDRCYVHGDPVTGQKRGLGLNCGRAAVRCCHFSGIFTPGQDSQAICGWNGSGDWLIEDNYLEAASENVLVGGATIHVPDLLPTTIVIRKNTLTKNPEWRGKGYVVKNLLELKTGVNVVVDQNDLSECWPDGQDGKALQITVRNEEGANPWAAIRNVMVTRNRVWNVGGVVNVLGRDDRGSRYESQLLVGLLFRDNEAWNVTDGGGARGNSWQIQGGDWVLIDHNTWVTDQRGDWAITEYLINRPCTNFACVNNIGIQGASYGSYLKTGSDDVATNGLIGAAALDVFALPYVYTHNVIVGGPSTGYPPGNFMPGLISEVGFMNPDLYDFRLSPDSPFVGQATDGTDIGARHESAPTPMMEV
jgi:hypothetical protein